MATRWPAVLAHCRYDDRVICANMLSLSERLSQSRYSEGLVVWTSVWDLCLSQTPFDPRSFLMPHIRISPQGNGEIELRFIDTPICDKQWHRLVPADLAFSRLERLFMELKWFAPPVART